MKITIDEVFDSIDISWIDKGTVAELTFDYNGNEVCLELDRKELELLQNKIHSILNPKTSKQITKIIDKIFNEMDYKYTSGGNQYSNGDPEFDKAKQKLIEKIKKFK